MTTETKATSLHGKIMNIVCDKELEPWANTREAYKYGHRDARHAAAELASEYDALVAQLVDALECLLENSEELINRQAARAALLSHKGER